jgi:hypothetical protein
MGFLDKAKKLADQAQTKLDEVQKDFNSQQGSGAQRGAQGGPAVEYDQHGRPISTAPATAAAPGVPDAPPDKSPMLDPNTPTSPDPEPNRPHGDPLLDDEPGSRHGTPPAPPSGGSGLSSGDPLAG